MKVLFYCKSARALYPHEQTFGCGAISVVLGQLQTFGIGSELGMVRR